MHIDNAKRHKRKPEWGIQMTFNSRLIAQVEQALTRVLKAKDGVSRNTETADAIVATLRKLRIARELSERYYVAVAGSQSAGKTRLIRELYGLDKTWLCDELGRGEKLPVFIIEKDAIDAPYGVQQKIDEHGEIVEEKVSAEVFRDLAAPKGIIEKRLPPKLYVPRQYFSDEHYGFVLLPGYEIENNDNSVWQRLMRRTLAMSIGAILVTDHVRFAEGSQAAIAADLAASPLLANRKPVIVVSKTETADDAKREQWVKRAGEVFNVAPDEQESRIVCSGVGDADYVAGWSSAIIRALNRYVLNETDSDEARIEDMLDLLDGELPAITAAIETELLSSDINSTVAERQRASIVDKFTEAAKKYRRGYERELRKSTRSYAARARNLADDRYSAEETGFRNKLEHAKEFLQLRSGEREKAHIARIVDCWKAVNDAASQGGEERLPNNPLESDFGVLSTMSKKHLQLEGVASANPPALLGYGETPPESPAWALIAEPAALADLKLVLQEPARIKSSTGDAPMKYLYEVKAPADPERLQRMVELIPALTMEFVRINQGIVLSSAEVRAELGAARSAGEVGKSLAENATLFTGSVRNVLRAVACILAVDVAIDGTVDSVPALLNAIFGAATAATGVAAMVSLVASGVVAIGFLAHSAIKEIHQYDAAKRGYINTVMDQLASSHVDQQLEVFDQLMESVHERMSQALGVAYRLDASIGYRDNLLRSLASLERARLNLMSEVRDRQVLA